MPGFDSVRIAVEKAITMKLMEFMIEDSRDYPDKYGPAAVAILAAQVASLAADHSARVGFIRAGHDRQARL